MIRFIVNRVLWAIPVLWLVATVTFFLMHAAPGSPWDAKSAGKQLDPSLEASFNRQYGLDKPLMQQYLIYLNNAVHFDFGTSYTQQGTSVEQIIMQGFPYSARIGIYALILSVLLGVPIGIIAALKQNTIVDYASLLFATIGYSLPSFVLAIFLLLLFAVQLQLIPVLFTDWRSYILPSVVLGMGSAAFLARLARSSILEILRQDYVRTARAKGLRHRIIVLRHVLRNGLIPVVTTLGPALAALITGTIIIENVFSVPGMGYLFIQSITARDYPVIMGTTLFYAFFVVLGNMLVDITYGIVDPRINSGA
jgi:oligopeptide transport system permease protein